MVPLPHPHVRSRLQSCKPCPASGNSSIRYSYPILWSRGEHNQPLCIPEEESMTLTETTLAATSSTAAAYVRPQPGEYTPYYDRYISLVPANDILAAFDDQ